MNKVILILIDGMRPDGFLNCGNDYTEEIMKNSSYSLNAKTVWPSLTLPCHMSLFYSVPPQRHGITSNTFTPFARPLNGLFEQIKEAEKISTMFYGWDPLRDVARPKSLTYSEYLDLYFVNNTDSLLTDSAVMRIKQMDPDFTFLYLGMTDVYGHDSGWMTEDYLRGINEAIDCVKRVYEEFGEEYTIILTADHGGHDRDHGNDIPEDMIIPVFFMGDMFEKHKDLGEISIMDIAPTIADIIGVRKVKQWEGTSLIAEK